LPSLMYLDVCFVLLNILPLFINISELVSIDFYRPQLHWNRALAPWIAS
jgi:hypothetical protein